MRRAKLTIEVIIDVPSISDGADQEIQAADRARILMADYSVYPPLGYVQQRYKKLEIIEVN